MDIMGISKSMLVISVIYLLSLLYGINFIISNVAFGGLTADFYLLALLILLPLPLHVFYFMRNRTGFSHEGALRIVIQITALIAIIVVAFFIVPISYF